MALIKNNLWKLFCFLLLGGLVLLSVLLAYEWRNIEKEYRTSSQNRVEFSAQALKSTLRNKELMLDLIGRDILSNNNLTEKTSTIKLLDNILLENPVLLGFGLFNPQGEIIYYSSNLNASTMINLKENEKTRQSFSQTLSSDKMVLG
jgi:hypothetical protein